MRMMSYLLTTHTSGDYIIFINLLLLSSVTAAHYVFWLLSYLKMSNVTNSAKDTLFHFDLKHLSIPKQYSFLLQLIAYKFHVTNKIQSTNVINFQHTLYWRSQWNPKKALYLSLIPISFYSRCVVIACWNYLIMTFKLWMSVCLSFLWPCQTHPSDTEQISCDFQHLIIISCSGGWSYWPLVKLMLCRLH